MIIKMFVKHAAAGAFVLPFWAELMICCVFSGFWADLVVCFADFAFCLRSWLFVGGFRHLFGGFGSLLADFTRKVTGGNAISRIQSG